LWRYYIIGFSLSEEVANGGDKRNLQAGTERVGAQLGEPILSAPQTKTAHNKLKVEAKRAI
jgi:hypothetical protein